MNQYIRACTFLFLIIVIPFASAEWKGELGLSSASFRAPNSVNSLSLPDSAATGIQAKLLYESTDLRWYGAAQYMTVGNVQVGVLEAEAQKIDYEQTAFSIRGGRIFGRGKVSGKLAFGYSSFSSTPKGSNDGLAGANAASNTEQLIHVTLGGRYTINDLLYADLSYSFFESSMYQIDFSIGYAFGTSSLFVPVDDPIEEEEVENEESGPEESPMLGFENLALPTVVEEKVPSDHDELIRPWDYVPSIRSGKTNYQKNPEEDVDDYTGKWTIALASYKVYEDAQGAVIKIRSMGIASYLRRHPDSKRYLIFARAGSSYEEAQDYYLMLKEEFSIPVEN